MPVRMVIWPPSAKPKVTAGFTWPPEMFAPMATATKRAKAWAIATATSPAGSSSEVPVNLATREEAKTPISSQMKSNDVF